MSRIYTWCHVVRRSGLFGVLGPVNHVSCQAALVSSLSCNQTVCKKSSVQEMPACTTSWPLLARVGVPRRWDQFPDAPSLGLQRVGETGRASFRIIRCLVDPSSSSSTEASFVLLARLRPPSFPTNSFERKPSRPGAQTGSSEGGPCDATLQCSWAWPTSCDDDDADADNAGTADTAAAANNVLLQLCMHACLRGDGVLEMPRTPG